MSHPRDKESRITIGSYSFVLCYSWLFVWLKTKAIVLFSKTRQMTGKKSMSMYV